MKGPVASGGLRVIETTSGKGGGSGPLAELAQNVSNERQRTERIVLSGHVQGVGFRPFVYRLAQRYKLTGSVQNQLGQVEVIATGPAATLQRFAQELIDLSPPLSKPSIESVDIVGFEDFAAFEITESSAAAEARIFVPQDFFMCDDCLEELRDPGDRRFRYPFINCTQCGPRYTLIEALPYDRPSTSMAGFPLCADCEAEYLDPADRRFHAEPVACPVCGPQLSFVDQQGQDKTGSEEALLAADPLTEALR